MKKEKEINEERQQEIKRGKTPFSIIFGLIFISGLNMFFFLDLLLGTNFHEQLKVDYPKHPVISGMVLVVVIWLVFNIVLSVIRDIIKQEFFDKITAVFYRIAFGFRLAVVIELVIELIKGSFWEMVASKLPEGINLQMVVWIYTIIVILIGYFIVTPLMMRKAITPKSTDTAI